MRRVCILVLMVLSPLVLALDATDNGKWISMGVPNYIHIGTEGHFYIQGNNHGSCASTVPGYFRLDMSKPHFDKFYSWLLLMSATKQPIDCVAKSGCGTNDLWVEYCRGPL
jgi:hypothetical protein